MMSDLPWNSFSLVSCHGLSSSDTHKLPAMKKLFRVAMDMHIFKHENVDPVIIDPFARKCQWGTKRNDINSEFYPQYTTSVNDALEFMTELESNSAHIVILDPPFSNRQSDEEYNTGNLYTNPAYMRDIGLQAFRVLRPGGYVLKCGYNSNPPYKGFELKGIVLCQMGACRNDIIMTLYQKVQTVLDWV